MDLSGTVDAGDGAAEPPSSPEAQLRAQFRLRSPGPADAAASGARTATGPAGTGAAAATVDAACPMRSDARGDAIAEGDEPRSLLMNVFLTVLALAVVAAITLGTIIILTTVVR